MRRKNVLVHRAHQTDQMLTLQLVLFPMLQPTVTSVARIFHRILFMLSTLTFLADEGFIKLEVNIDVNDEELVLYSVGSQ